MFGIIATKLAIIITLWEVTQSFIPTRYANPTQLGKALFQAKRSLDFDESTSFDAVFAESISKPLPEWYIEAQKQREIELQELIKYREQIIRDFKAKYYISEEEKIAEKNRKVETYKEKLRNRKKQPKGNIFSGIFGSKKNEETMENMELEEDDVTTKEKWDLFWDKEQKETGFYLPGFFEVFPELKFRWPTWSKDKNGKARMCETDQDCPFPQACCPHPIVPGQKFCCTGTGTRVMVPAYAFQEAKPAFDHTKAQGGQKPL